MYQLHEDEPDAQCEQLTVPPSHRAVPCSQGCAATARSAAATSSCRGTGSFARRAKYHRMSLRSGLARVPEDDTYRSMSESLSCY